MRYGYHGKRGHSGGGNVENSAVNRFGPCPRWMSYEAIFCGLRMIPHVGEWNPTRLSNSMTLGWRLLENRPYLVLSLSYKDEDNIERW